MAKSLDCLINSRAHCVYINKDLAQLAKRIMDECPDVLNEMVLFPWKKTSDIPGKRIYS